MEEYIGKVKLNLDFYKGTDTYSDGDIEEQLLETVKSGTDLEEFLTKENDWTFLYHFSKIRHNILEWYDFGEGKSLLEIGAGCGAISGLFCEKVDRVVAIDLSKRRSSINAYRNQTHDNLEIIVGNFQDIETDEKFDYVTLIGVLEYSIYYIGSEDPFHDMLRKAKSYLKPGGKLIIAIENKYGMKYWAGATEDHTGGFFDGIEGYDGVDRVRTFSRHGLEKLIKESGFTETEFYYPVPDYKMPIEIYSEERLPKRGSIKTQSPAYDRNRIELFSEAKALDSICEERLFEEFANSFLVICG